MIRITEKQNCCGCTACAQSCPVNAISMITDEEGFYYPKADELKCISCGKCDRVCPIINPQEQPHGDRDVYIAQNRDKVIRLDSTSGGVFSALAQFVIDKNGYVFGAELDGDFCVHHGQGKTREDLLRFRGSKYVQSRMGNTFREVREQLNNNNWVLFSGTPCQVAGLHAFLGKAYEKLILMDIVCYSISSPGIWKQFLEHLEKTGAVRMGDVERIKFRDKTKFGYEYTLMTFYGKNNKVLYSSGPESNQMLRSFVSNTSTRPSCYSCQFKGVERFSDFTAWDCYNIYQYDKHLDDNQGSSHVMVHTEKGKQLINEIEKYLTLQKVDTQIAVTSEPALTDSSSPSEMREDFFRKYRTGEDVFDTFFLDTGRVKIERFLRYSLSKLGIYKYAKRIMKG